MGILNLTPDSFSDGGEFNTVQKAVKRARKMIKEGVDIIDIGGESSVAGSKEVTLSQELERVIPVLKELKAREIDIPISIDTYKAEVAKQALELGVKMINDITAMRGDPGMAEVLGYYKPFVVLMYTKNESARTTFDKTEYKDVVMEIKKFLLERVRIAIRYGIPREKIILDPGLGFFLSSANDPQPSFEVINRLWEFGELGFPILISPSRKSFLGGKVEERGIKTLAASAICVYNGADFLRVHDVKEHREVIDTVQNCLQYRKI
jgi:dihydropteroate synthase